MDSRGSEVREDAGVQGCAEMSRIDQDDGCTYLTAGESINATVSVTIRLTVSVSGVQDLEDIDNSKLEEVINDTYGIDCLDFEILSSEIEDYDIETE